MKGKSARLTWIRGARDAGAMFPPGRISIVFIVLVAAACMAGGGCDWLYKSEHNYVEHFQLMAEGPPQDDRGKALAALHAWLPSHGYSLLTSPADIDAATTWRGRGGSYEEVWRKTIDPSVPKSEFVVSVSETGSPKVLIIELAAERWGTDADHARQIPMEETERGEFYKVFDGFPWLKKTDIRGPAVK